MICFSFKNEVFQTASTVKDIPIKSNKTFLLEYWNLFFYIYSNKMLEVFKNKNTNNFNKNLLESLSLDDLYNNKKSNLNENNSYLINKINSEYSLSEKLNEKNEDKKKIISDNKIHELYENNSNEINEKLIPPKLGFFSSSSLNNLGGMDPNNNSFLFLDPFNRQQSNNNLDSNLSLFRFQPLATPSFQNPMNGPPSLSNLNKKNILTPPNINQRDIFNYCNNLKSSNSNLLNNSNKNMLQINAEICPQKTLLAPPPSINNYTSPFLPKIKTSTSLIPPMNDNNLNNLNFTSSLNEKNILKEKEKNSTTLNMFNKKRKRDIKNNKLVFILGDNKKEKKEKIKQKKNIEDNKKKENKENAKKDENSEKNHKPRGSKYRGVSRNGNQWQVLIMVNKKKRYVGSYSREEDAARAYDKVALQNHGTKAKTNFDYTKKEVEDILASPQILKLND